MMEKQIIKRMEMLEKLSYLEEKIDILERKLCRAIEEERNEKVTGIFNEISEIDNKINEIDKESRGEVRSVKITQIA